MVIVPPFEHQKEVTAWLLSHPRALVTSDPGTGKTRSVLDAHMARRSSGRLLVIAPLLTLESAWAGDIQKFCPSLTYSFAFAGKREKGFEADTDVVLMNHDATVWLNKQKRNWLQGFSTICIDEFTAFKHRRSQRSRALASIMRKHNIQYRIAMSGTPNGNTITDIWHPVFLVDDGASLGSTFRSFENSVCTAIFNPHNKKTHCSMVPRPGAEKTVALLLQGINIRFALKDCLDLPDQSVRELAVPLSKYHQDAYRVFSRDALLDIKNQRTTGVHAASKAQRLLQLASGVVYDDQRATINVDLKRIQVATDYVNQVDTSIVVFIWHCQRDFLARSLRAKNIPFAILDGDTPRGQREGIIRKFQEGSHYKTLLLHPAAAGYGITLTAANTLIWLSPTYNAEHYLQTNARIHRAGQNRNTEVVHMYSPGTGEKRVYGLLQNKLLRLESMLTALASRSSDS